MVEAAIARGDRGVRGITELEDQLITDAYLAKAIVEDLQRPYRRLWYVRSAVVAAALGAALLLVGTPPPEPEDVLFVEALDDDLELGFARIRQNVAAKGRVEALVVYAQFKDEAERGEEIPEFAGELFATDRPGSYGQPGGPARRSHGRAPPAAGRVPDAQRDVRRRPIGLRR